MFISSKELKSIQEVAKEALIKFKKVFSLSNKEVEFEGVEDSFCKFKLSIKNPNSKIDELETHTDDFTITNSEGGEIVIAKLFY